VGEAIRACRPWAVDVSSGVETEPGVKDHGAIRAFCEAVRTADAAGDAYDGTVIEASASAHKERPGDRPGRSIEGGMSPSRA
jgi:hypothetical protein